MRAASFTTLPDDLRDALRNDPAALATWEDITPLARNEWICWVESAKKAETRTKRLEWGRGELAGRETPALLLAGLFSSLTFDALRTALLAALHMVPRYSRPEMSAIWSAENRFRIWFAIEVFAAEAMGEGRDDPGRGRGDDPRCL